MEIDQNDAPVFAKIIIIISHPRFGASWRQMKSILVQLLSLTRITLLIVLFFQVYSALRETRQLILQGGFRLRFPRPDRLERTEIESTAS